MGESANLFLLCSHFSVLDISLLDWKQNIKN